MQRDGGGRSMTTNGGDRGGGGYSPMKVSEVKVKRRPLWWTSPMRATGWRPKEEVGWGRSALSFKGRGYFRGSAVV